jgi:hypothetical protein
MVFKPKLTPLQRQFIRDVYRADRALRPDGKTARRNLRLRLAAMFGVAGATIGRAASNWKQKRKRRRRKVFKPKTTRGPMSLRTHCPAGHEYTAENTIILKKARKDGSIGHKRQCRACKKAWQPKALRVKTRRAQGGSSHAEG